METKPMPLDAHGADSGGLDEFRISVPREIALIIRQLYDANLQINLVASNGSSVNATVWTIDAPRASMGFAVDAADAGLPGLLESTEVVAVGYLDAVKLQFDAHDLVLVHGARSSVLNCALPRELFRFQRRNAYRVRPLMRGTPVARVRHSDIAEMQLALRVLDVSIGGCALFLPDDIPPMQPGVVLNQVQIDLDADTRFHVNLRLQHVTSLSTDARGVRLGCEFVHADSTTLRSLQRFIDQTQKRGRFLSIG
jgi:c-di-GMP-binding flagellar brake protein YcgR